MPEPKNSQTILAVPIGINSNFNYLFTKITKYYNNVFLAVIKLEIKMKK